MIGPEMREHLAMGEPEANNPGRQAAAEGFSALVARILDQLSLSAWLPAGMLVGSLSVLIQLRAQPSHSVADAVLELTRKPLGVLVLLVSALVLCTLVTQAFEFEVIRLLEGYWGNSPIVRIPARLGVRLQGWRLHWLVDARDDLELGAFRSAGVLQRIPAEKRYIFELLEHRLEHGSDLPVKGWRARRRLSEAKKYDWEVFASAELLRRLDAVTSRMDEFPAENRLLPTKLGNCLRATEDRLSLGEADLEGLVMRKWEDMPGALRKEHNDHRTRLDMYCMLVFVFLVLAVAGPALISRGESNRWVTVGLACGYAGLAWISYEAAIASARGYATVLRAVAEVGPTEAQRRIIRSRWMRQRGADVA